MVKTIYTLVLPDSTMLQMKKKLHKKKGIPIHEMELWYNNRQLEEDKRLSDYGITNGTSLTLRVWSHPFLLSSPEINTYVHTYLWMNWSQLRQLKCRLSTLLQQQPWNLQI